MSDLSDALDEALEAEQRLDAADRKKLGGLPSWPPKPDAPPDEFAGWLSAVFYDVVTHAERWGSAGDTGIAVFLQDGRKLAWDEQDDLQTLTRLRGPLIRAGLRPRALTPHAVGLVAWAITRLAILRADSTIRDEAESWGASYLRERPLREAAKTKDPAGWRQALQAWQAIDDHDPKSRRPRHERPFVLLDSDSGERFVRRGDFGAHVRSRVRGGMGWRKIAARMAEVGWQQDRFQHRATVGGAPPVGARVFVLPQGWGQDPAVDSTEEPNDT